MKVLIKQASIEEKPILKKLMEPYFEELNQFFEESRSTEEYKYLDLYWIENGRIPFLINSGETPIGLVLINSYTRIPENNGAKTIAEFYIVKEFRNKGVGTEVAIQIFGKKLSMNIPRVSLKRLS